MKICMNFECHLNKVVLDVPFVFIKAGKWKWGRVWVYRQDHDPEAGC